LIISVEGLEDELEEFKGLIKDMANVKRIEYGEVASKPVAEPNYPELGPKFGGDAEIVADLIEELDTEQVKQLQDVGEIEIDGYDVTESDVEIRQETTKGVSQLGFSRGNLYLDLNMTEEVKEEAFVAEVIRAIQQKRKDEGLEVGDEVGLSFSGATEVLEKYSDVIKSRVNLEELDFDGRELEYEGEVEFKDFKTRFMFSEPRA
jgi:isoleucyl-tRNA synthetase